MAGITGNDGKDKDRPRHNRKGVLRLNGAKLSQKPSFTIINSSMRQKRWHCCLKSLLEEGWNELDGHDWQLLTVRYARGSRRPKETTPQQKKKRTKKNRKKDKNRAAWIAFSARYAIPHSSRAHAPKNYRLSSRRRTGLGSRARVRHNQHVRHRPPWINRPWVMTENGRASMLGHTLQCKKCDIGAPRDRPIN